jgi:hypothetical protein
MVQQGQNMKYGTENAHHLTDGTSLKLWIVPKVEIPLCSYSNISCFSRRIPLSANAMLAGPTSKRKRGKKMP